MSELQQNRYDQLVRRVGGLIGPGSKVNDALSELFPMIDVETLVSELQALAGTRLGFGGIELPASAANANKIQLFNPVGSNSLVVPTRIVISSTAGGLVTLGTGTVMFPVGPGINRYRDTRLGVPTQTLAVIQTLVDPTSGGNFAPMSFGSNLPIDLFDPEGLFVLAPGTSINVTNTTVNRSLAVWFMWRERPAQPSELLI